MTDLFEPAFLERQQAVYPRLDVRVFAGAVAEMARAKPVRNPNGLLVHWLARAEKRMKPRTAADAAAERADLERYAVLWVELLKRVATRQLSPEQIARCLAMARADGYPKLNRMIEQRLHAMGSAWFSAGPARARGRRQAAHARREV